MAAVSVKRSIITIACEQARHFWRVKRFARERASHFRVSVRVPFTRDSSRLVKIEFGVTFMTKVKRESVPRDQIFSLVVRYCHYNYANISRFTPVLSIRIVFRSFYLIIFYFENFSVRI